MIITRVKMGEGCQEIVLMSPGEMLILEPEKDGDEMSRDDTRESAEAVFAFLKRLSGDMVVTLEDLFERQKSKAAGHISRGNSAL